MSFKNLMFRGGAGEHGSMYGATDRVVVVGLVSCIDKEQREGSR